MQTNPKDEQDKVTEILEKLAYALFALRHEEDDKKRLKKQTEEFSFARLEIEKLMLTEEEIAEIWLKAECGMRWYAINGEEQEYWLEKAQALIKAQKEKMK